MGIFYQVRREATEMIKKMTKVRDMREIKANSSGGVWAILKRLMPNSSGRGEMMIRPPIKGSVQEK